MNIRTEHDIDGETVVQLRKSLGLSQSEFWGRIGLSQSAGSVMELTDASRRGGRAGLIQRPYQKLIFLEYVAGISVDASTVESAEKVMALGEIAKSVAAAEKFRAAKKDIGELKRALATTGERIVNVVKRLG